MLSSFSCFDLLAAALISASLYNTISKLIQHYFNSKALAVEAWKERLLLKMPCRVVIRHSMALTLNRGQTKYTLLAAYLFSSISQRIAKQNDDQDMAGARFYFKVPWGEDRHCHGRSVTISNRWLTKYILWIFCWFFNSSKHYEATKVMVWHETEISSYMKPHLFEIFSFSILEIIEKR